MIKHFLMAALLLAASAGGCSSDDDDDNNSGYNGGDTVTNGDVTRGLLAYFTFDDGSARNLRDASNSGTIYPGTNFSYTSDTPNGKGQALSLGNKEYVNIPNNTVEGNSAFSVSMWVKDFGIGSLFVSTFLDDTFNGSPRLFVDSNNYFCADGTEEIYDTHLKFGLAANAYQSGRWHMITATFANKTINLYIDGTLVGKATHDAKTKGHGNKTCIGGMANGILNNPMKVDNVRVYGVALTDAEVQSLYNYELQ